jgi:hypothetical protein
MNFHLSNKPGINTAVMQSTHPQQQRKMTMKKVVSTLMLSTAIVTSSISLPTHAAVIDTVKDKVIAIKKDTGSIKSQTSGIKTRVEEISSSVNANIAETIDIRTALDPIFGIRAKFEELGIDPAELLENIPKEEIKEMIDKMRAKKIERQEMLSEDVEPFRAEFLELLVGLNEIIRPEGEDAQVTPLQTLVEKAPPPVLAVLRVITRPIFERLQKKVVAASLSLQNLRDLGVFDAMQLASPLSHSPLALNNSNSGSPYLKAGITSEQEIMCKLAEKSDPVGFAVWQFQWQSDEIKHLIAATRDKVVDNGKDTNYELQIHGWLKFLSFNPFDGLVGTLDEIEKQVEVRQMRIGYVGELADRALEWGDCEAVMGYVSTSANNAL